MPISFIYFKFQFVSKGKEKKAAFCYFIIRFHLEDDRLALPLANTGYSWLLKEANSILFFDGDRICNWLGAKLQKMYKKSKQQLVQFPNLSMMCKREGACIGITRFYVGLANYKFTSTSNANQNSLLV